jgi:adenylate kinase
MRIVVSGPPSCGKSTQCRRLAHVLGVPHVSSGALIRDGARAGDPVASRLAAIVEDGSLAPSDAIVGLVMRRIFSRDCSAGFVLDGFPRREEEADALIRTLSPLAIDAFVVFVATAETLRDRLADRSRQSAFLRLDDDPVAFPHRVAVYLAETVPVRALVAGRGVPVSEVDVSGDPGRVHERLLATLGLSQPLPDDSLCLFP